VIVRGAQPAFSILIVTGLLLVGTLTACSQTFDAARLGVPITMAASADQPLQGARFKVRSHAVFAFWGVTKIKEPSLRKALAAQLAGGSAVGDLRITVHSRFPDVLVTILTAGLLVPRSVTFEGVVVK
jgi:hypothetical protein